MSILHSVPPPKLPNVIDSVAVEKSSTGNLSISKVSSLPPESSTSETNFKQGNQFSLSQSSVRDTQELSTTSEPEIVLPPEFSASSLKPNQNFNVAYPSEKQPASSQRLNHFEAASFMQTVSKSKDLSQTEAESITKKLVRAKSQKQVTQKIAEQKIQKPTKINFYSQNNNSTKNPGTIEFKSRSQKTAQQQTITIPQSGNTNNQPAQQPQPSTTPLESRRVIEIIADRQTYDETRRVVTAEGNVVVRFDGSVVDADSLQVNIDNLIAVGEGNVAVTRGEQVLRGQRFTYNFIQDTGDLDGGSGEINIAQAQQDFSFTSPDSAPGGVSRRPPSDRIRRNQPLTNVGSPGGIGIELGGRSAGNLPSGEDGGEVRRMRFEAARIDFYPRGWEAKDVRITNDPFSPPELELRADSVTLNQISPREDKLRLRKPRLVFDRGLTLGIGGYTRTIDRNQEDATPALVSFGFDGDERGGLFLERSFRVANSERVSWKVTPQFFAQQAVDKGTGNFPSLFGLKSSLQGTLNPRTQVRGSASLTSLDLDQLEGNLRASVRLNHLVGDPNRPHQATLEYSYRDRLYNGTLGFQTVQSSVGGVIISPNIPLGKTGLNLRYQGGAQRINANTDRQDLLDTNRSNDRISLGRFQASASIGGGVNLWRGKPLAATENEGLKYTANPVVPYVQLFGSVTGTGSYYTNGDQQNTLIGTIGVQGQFGNFSKNFLDYTGFSVSYSQGTNDGLSPFLFDRYVDNKVLNLGITQQLYGPFRVGFQTGINLDTNERTSTDYTLEYSRRSYGITLRYNPVLELGGISFRINDFNWSGGTDPFSEDAGGVKPVVGGVEQR